MFWSKENPKESQPSIYQKEVMPRKDHFASTVRIRDTWYENATNHNIADHAER